MMEQNSIRVPPEGGWHCKAFIKQRTFLLDGRTYCPRCGREVRERYYRSPSGASHEWKRVHVGTFHTLDGC